MKVHYTYFLTAVEPFQGMKYYIGVRSCEGNPENDKYIGSSKIINRNKIQVEKHILSTWSSRKEAVSHEVLLHDCFNVAKNKEFFNQAKQTSTGFDTTGIEPPIKGKNYQRKLAKRLGKVRLAKSIPKKQIELSLSRWLDLNI